jgi:hypothetical protein
MAMYTNWPVQGIVGSPTKPFEVIHGEIVFQLSHFRLHLLRVRFALMMCQGLLRQDELVQLVSNIEIDVLVLEMTLTI